MADEQEAPRLRLALLQFPTDALTIGDLRRAQPKLFSEEGLFRDFDIGPIYSLDAITFMRSERILAQKAFAVAAGLPDPWPKEDRGVEIEDLNRYYVQMGLSHGLRETGQMVRAFEKAAAQQAGPPPRGRSR
jgi:hypothetical protein